MAVTLILSTDTLETGFRVKANNNFNEIIESVTPGEGAGALPNGTYIFNKNGGGQIVLNITDQYYTKNQIATLIAQLSSSPYSGAWVSKAYAPPAVVDHNGTFWRALTPTSTEPGTDGTWQDILLDLIPVPTEHDFPAGTGSTDLDLPYSDVTVPGLYIYAEQYTVDLDVDPTGGNVFIPYPLTYFKIPATNHILFRKQDDGDHIKITIKT